MFGSRKYHQTIATVVSVACHVELKLSLKITVYTKNTDFIGKILNRFNINKLIEYDFVFS